MNQIEAKRKLAASIRNERRTYDQTRFNTLVGDDYLKPATCGTAACVAGHIEACWPRVTKRLAPSFSFAPNDVDHRALARAVWREVTGKPCRFDFSSGPDLQDENGDVRYPTREEAVAHIYGRNKAWPLEMAR